MKTRVIQDEPDDERPAHTGIDQLGKQRSAKGNPMSGIVSVIRKHRLVAFFVITYVLAWWSWPLYGLGIFPEVMFIPAAPLVAALVVIAVAEGKAGFKDLGARIIRWRVPWYMYVVALGLPLVVRFSGTAVNVGVFDAPGLDWSTLAWSSFALAFAVRLVNVMDGPAGEEPGFRGFALPRMQVTHSPLFSGAVLGVLVAGWHLPLAFGENVGLVGLITTFSITLVYVWLFNRTGGSVLLTLLFHNMQGAVQVGDLFGGSADVMRQNTIECVIWSAVAVGLIVGDRSAWRTAPAAAVYPPMVPSAPDRPLVGAR